MQQAAGSEAYTPPAGLNTFISGLQVQERRLNNTIPGVLVLSNPQLLQGIICYVDASTTPDHPTAQPRNAGICITFFNPQVQPALNVHIKAQMTESTSVLMAEAAALALAASISQALHFQDITFLSDCELLVKFLNSSDLSNPPDWRSKIYTQQFINFKCQSQARIFNINRDINRVADSLAKQAFSAHVNLSSEFHFECLHACHASQCPVKEALLSVTLNSVRLLAAQCC